MIDGYMVLDADHNVIPADLHTWGQFFNDRAARTVGRTDIGEVFVSTVFLGVDHNFGGGPPLWFETMVFHGEWDQATFRYTTWEQAEAGHARVVEAIREGQEP